MGWFDDDDENDEMEKSEEMASSFGATIAVRRRGN